MAESDQLFARFGKTCEPGEVLFREGDEGSTMYVLQAGAVRISKAVKGEEKTLAILGPGEFFGEMAILNAKPRTATAVVEADAKVLVLGAKTFEQMVIGNAEIAVRLIKKLARRLDSANELIEVLMHRDPRARVILGLSREAQFLGEPQEDGSVRVPLSPQELAEQVGLAEAEILEVLKRLARLKIAQVTGDGIVVTDVRRLDEFYEFLEMREKFGGRLMELRVLGCHGGETPKHKTSSFLLDGKIALDAGAVTSMLTLEEQRKVETVLVSHAHLDHIKDLATLADNRCQQGGPTVTVAGVSATIDILKKHFFNGLLWPDFSQIPTPLGPTVRFEVLEPEVPTELSGATVRAIMVNHTIDTCAFIVSGSRGAIAYSGDTGPTDRFWEALRETENLRGLLMEVSFPDEHHQLAKVSGHHTPETLSVDLEKLRGGGQLPVMLYHIKPVFEGVVEKQLARIRGQNMEICRLGDQYLL